MDILGQVDQASHEQVPRNRLRNRSPVTVALGLPTGARPGNFTGIDDDRLLSFALHRLDVSPIRTPDAVPLP